MEDNNSYTTIQFVSIEWIKYKEMNRLIDPIHAVLLIILITCKSHLRKIFDLYIPHQLFVTSL